MSSANSESFASSCPIWVPFICFYSSITIARNSKTTLNIKARMCSLVKKSFLYSVQFSCSTCPTLYDPTNHSTPALPVHHQLPEFTQTCPSSRWCHPAISSSVVPFSSCPQSLPASGSFQMSHLFAWGGQSTGVSALTSFLPKNSQGWSPSEWTGWI